MSWFYTSRLFYSLVEKACVLWNAGSAVEETCLAVNRMLLLLLKSDIKGPKLTIIPQASHWSQTDEEVKLESSRFQTVPIELACLNYSAATINRALKYFGKSLHPSFTYSAY